MSSNNAEEVDTGEIKTFIKLNFIVSVSLILLILSISSLNNNPLVSIITLPIILILTYYEEKANFTTILYGRYIYLFSSLGMLFVIIFWIFPFYFGIGLLNVQFLLLSLSSYVIFQVFERLKYFQEKTVLIIQNLLVVASFTIILYSFFPIIEFVYLQFIVDPNVLLISNILIHTIIVLAITLLSFYFSYARFRLYEKPWKLFNYCIVILFLLLETTWFVIVTINNVALGIPEVFQGELILCSILLPIIFLLFVLFNYIIRIFSREISLVYSYYVCWFLLFSIFFTLFIIFWNNFVILLLDLVYLSVFILFNLRFGHILKKVKDSTFNFIIRVDSFTLLIEIFLLFYGIFSFVFLLDEFLALFLSCCVIGVIFNLIPSNVVVVPRKVKITLTLFILIFDIVIVGFFFLDANINDFYVYLITPIIFCFLVFAPIYYLYGEKVLKPKFIAIYTYSSSWVLMFLFFALNLLIIVIYFSAHLIIGTLFDLLFISICLVILISYGKKIRMLKESKSRSYLNIISYPIVFEVFALLLTFFMIYMKLDLLISSFLSLTIISLIVYLDSQESKIFPQVLALILNSFTLYLGLFMVGYYSAIYTKDSFLVYFIPLILVSLLSYIPIYYLHKKNIMNRKSFLIYHFFCSSIIVLSVFIFNFYLITTLFFTILNSLIVLNILYITIACYYTLKLGVKIDVISHEKVMVIENYISYLIMLEAFFIMFSIFNQQLQFEPIFSAYISIVLICLIINFLSKKRILFSEKISNGFNIVTLCFTSILISFYLFLFLSTSVYAYNIPLLILGISLLFPLFYSLNKNIFTRFIERLLIIDSLVISVLVISLPYLIGLDFNRLGLVVDYYIINSAAIALFFGFLVFLEFLFDKYKLKESYFVSVKTCQIITWVILSFIISAKFFVVLNSFTHNVGIDISCSSLVFLVLNLVILIPLENLKQRIFENEQSKLDYYRIYKIYEYTKNISYFFIEFIVASLTIFLFPLQSIHTLFQLQESLLLTLTTYVGIFLLSYLLVSTVSRYLFKIQFSRLRWAFDLSAWVLIKILLCFYILIIPAQLSLIQRIGLPLVFLLFISPITIYYLRNNFFISDDSLAFYKRLIYYIFYFGLIIIFSELYWNYSQVFPFYSAYQPLRLIILFCGIYSLFNYYLVKYNDIIENVSEFKLIKILLGPTLLLFTFFSIFPSVFEYFSYVFFIIMIYLLISNRNRNYVFRTISYFSLSWLILVKLITTLNYYMLLPSLDLFDFPFYLFYFNFSLMIVLFFSIVLNIRNVNVIEKFALYLLISIITFNLLLYNTIIPLIYNISFSLFLFLILTGNFYYKQKNDLYKWFIRPCVLLMVFNLISFLSYYILFNNPIFIDFNPILTFTLTLSVTSISYVGTYNKAPENFRRRSFYIAFSSYIISIPTFMYFFLNASFNLPVWDPFLLIITINIGILLFYLSVGFYYWKFSWVIWKTGWRLWIIVPFVNFYIINESFTDINIYTNTLNFFGILNISGSFIISFTICVLLSLPFWYSWIKKHFSRILLIVWSFSLFFLYWFSQNVFFDNIVITNIVFFVFAVSLLMPVIYRMKMWKIITLLWLFYIFINVSFLVILFQEISLPLEISLSINLIVLGFFFVILSFFPNLKNLKNIILVSSYFLSLIGIFLTIFLIINSIILNFFISINLSFIILAFSLFSSRILKLNRTFFNTIISSILIVNFSFFTYNTFMLIPNIEIIALSLAITVFGGSVLVFNKFRMIMPLKKIFPLVILSIGTSLTLSSLVYVFLPGSIFLLCAIFIFVNLIFIRPALYEYRFILWYISPLALTLLTLQFIILIELFQSLYFIVLLSLLIYSAYFSVSRLLFIKKIEEQRSEKDYGMTKFDSIMSLLSHFELGLLSLGLIQELMNINLYGAILLSVTIFFLSTLLDIHILKRTIEKITYLLNIVAFLVISIGSLIYFVQFTGTDATLFVLNLVVFLMLQFYTLHYLSYYIEVIIKYDASRIKKIRNQSQAILLNMIFIVISIYLSLLLNDLLLAYNPLLLGIPSWSFVLAVFSFLMFLLNGFLNRTVEIKYKNIILFSTFIAFQLFFGIFWLALFITFSILDFLRIVLVILSETILTAYSIHLSKVVIKSEEWVIKTKKLYSVLVFTIYLEISVLFLGLFGLFFGFFESLLYSQIILFLISILEIYGIKRLKAGYIDVVHCLSYLNISWTLLLILFHLYGFSITSLFYIFLIFLSMQYYTNISYFNVRSKFNPEKLEIFGKWKINRQNYLGIGLYFFLIASIFNSLTAFGIEFHIAILILSILTHLIGLLDKFILKFLKKTSKFFIITSWIVMIGFSILFYIDWNSLFFPQLFPITIILFIIQIAYLFRLISEWDYISSNISKIKNGLILIVYFDLITWPLYYTNPDYFISFNLLILSFIILLILTFIDKFIKVVSDKARNFIRISGFICIETLLSIDIFITLEFIINPNLILNLCISLFIFMIVNLVLFKPFKRSKLFSFLYSVLMFLLLSLITLNLTSSGWSFSWILIGTLLYLFIFMLEELKKFLNNIIDNLRFALIKFKNFLVGVCYSIFNFLKKHFKLIGIILCLFVGIIVGILFSNIVLGLLRWDHASLLGGATAGILILLLPFAKTDDVDQVFKQRMQRFIGLWICFTIFVFALILPYLTSIIFGIILILSSIIILGAILAIYIYRIEKKQKISIKWRFYTTIILIVLTVIWTILLVVLYLTEIVV
ncbi:MAG: hypothetical protein KGD68_01055 [Candidatus Lokiarchaeota archaeon]|nr:hypothetical protein [Candidatus Lokiarchaeota archaeon]